MHSKAIKINEIYKALTMLPDEKLNEVKDFIDFIQYKFQTGEKPVVKLKGIWEGKGFEKISDLEGEIKSIKKDIASTVLKKKI